MATERQVAANRRNAQLSTGPKTAAGKTASRRNALTHGLTAKTMLLAHEDPAQFTQFSQRLYTELKPDGAEEETLATNLVWLYWRLGRTKTYEAMTLEWNKCCDLRRPLKPEEKHLALGRAIDIAGTKGLLSELTRHEGSLMRSLKETSQLLLAKRSERVARNEAAKPADVSANPVEVTFDSTKLVEFFLTLFVQLANGGHPVPKQLPPK